MIFVISHVKIKISNERFNTKFKITSSQYEYNKLNVLVSSATSLNKVVFGTYSKFFKIYGKILLLKLQNTCEKDIKTLINIL